MSPVPNLSLPIRSTAAMSTSGVNRPLSKPRSAMYSGISAMPWSADSTINVWSSPTFSSMNASRSAIVRSSCRTMSSFSRLDGPKKWFTASTPEKLTER